MSEQIYIKSINGKPIQLAKLKLLGIGKYGFETSLFGEKPYEINMNTPLFDTEDEALQWIEIKAKWEKQHQ